MVDGYTAMHARPFTLVSYSKAHNNAQRTESGRCYASHGMEDATAAGGTHGDPAGSKACRTPRSRRVGVRTSDTIARSQMLL